jgi:hypothetical protein
MSPHPWPYATAPDAAPPLDADRLILWLARHQWRTLLGGVLFGVPWMLSIALVPAAIGKAVDDGLVARDPRALVTWAAAIMGLGLVSAVTTNGRHWFAVRNWLISSFRTAVVTERAVRRAGPAVTRQMPAGQVVTSFASDFWRMGEVFDVTARLAGAIVSFIVVSAILLRGSVLLGVIMLVGGPLLLASLALVVRPLHRRQQAQREEAGQLTALGADTVAGLRVLRGIGGEDTFLARYAAQSERVRLAGVRLSPVQATLDAAQVLLPGIFVVVVTGIGAHLAVGGEITPGQLVAFYGYTAFLTMPLRTATEFVDKLTRTRVAARRIVKILAIEPDHAPAGRTSGDLLVDGGTPVVDVSADLVDPASGVVVVPGQFTALVSADPEDTAQIAQRLGRLLPGRHGVRWGEVDLDDLPIDRVTLAGRRLRRRPPPVQRAGARRPRRRRRRCARGSRCTSRAPRMPSTRSTAVWTASSRSAAVPCRVGSANGSPWRGRCFVTPRCSCSSNRPVPSTPTPRPASLSDLPRTVRDAPLSSSPRARSCSTPLTWCCSCRTGRPPPPGATVTSCARIRPTATSCCEVRTDVTAPRPHRPRGTHPADRDHRDGPSPQQGAAAPPPRAR